MKLKKCFAVCLTCALLATAWMTPASAHGHHGGHHSRHHQVCQTTTTQYYAPPAANTQTAPLLDSIYMMALPIADMHMKTGFVMGIAVRFAPGGAALF